MSAPVIRGDADDGYACGRLTPLPTPIHLSGDEHYQVE